jgi:hypothetical protein
MSVVLNSSSQYNLLATDYAPFPDEARLIQATIDEQQEQLQCLDSDIASTSPEVQLEELHAERAAITEAIEIRSALLAPVRRLSPETLGEIFWLCLPSLLNGTTSSNIEQLESAPLLLTHVSRQWRRIARGNPRLWTTLAATANKDPSVIIPLFLQLSASLPLDIFLDIYQWHDPSIESRDGYLGPDGEEYETEYQERNWRKQICTALHPIHEQIYRCRTLHLSAEMDTFVFLNELFPSGTETHALSLETLFVADTYTGSLHPPGIGSIVAPKLRSLNICSDPTPLLASLSASSHILQELKIASPEDRDLWTNPDIFAGFLTSCSMLHVCNIDFGSMRDILDFLSPTELPELQTLFIHLASAPFNSTSFISSLHFPALETLYLDCEDYAATLDFNTILQSSRWSLPPTLRQMTLYHIDISQEAFLRVLSMATGLESLELAACAGTRWVLPALTPAFEDAHSEWMCPRLERLELSYVHLSGGSLVSLIAARAPPPGLEPEQHTTGRYLLKVVLGENCTCAKPSRTNKGLERLAESHDGLDIDGCCERNEDGTNSSLSIFSPLAEVRPSTIQMNISSRRSLQNP